MNSIHIGIRCFIWAMLLLWPTVGSAQRLIEYEAGLGRRDRNDPDTWILCRDVKAEHEGMVLYADSALLNTKRNDFTAYYGIEIMLTDTTFIYGNELYYDGITRQVDIWDDTVIFIDGNTILYTDHLAFDRNANKAYYNTWGHVVNGRDTLDSYYGIYDATQKEVFIYDHVILRDSASRLHTDTLIYLVREDVAKFHSPTYIYSDTTTLYSENGSYYTQRRYAVSTQKSRIKNGSRWLMADTIYYDENLEYGQAYHNVFLFDSVNDVICTGHYGEMSQQRRVSYVTDSAQVLYVSEGDTLYMHADTLYVVHTEAQEVQYVQAYYHVKLYRNDVQAACDSAFYHLQDSVIYLHGTPIFWQEEQQCTADTIKIFTTHAGVRQADFMGHCFVVERLDPLKYNQVKGNNARMYFVENEPHYADILGNAEMVYYITEEYGVERLQRLMGVNVGVGSDMRIYFANRRPTRVVTYSNPDMYTYPPDKLPPDKVHLEGFHWYADRRPYSKEDIFK